MFENDFSKTKFCVIPTVLFAILAIICKIQHYNNYILFSVVASVAMGLVTAAFLINGLYLKRKEERLRQERKVTSARA